MSQYQHGQPDGSAQPDDHNTSIPHQTHEAAQEKPQPLAQDSEEELVIEDDFQEDNPPSSGSLQGQTPQLSKKEKLLAKRAKLDAQIKREIEKERKERTHRLCLLAGMILKIEKDSNTLTDIIADREHYDLNDDEIDNILYCLKNYKN